MNYLHHALNGVLVGAYIVLLAALFFGTMDAARLAGTSLACAAAARSLFWLVAGR